MSHRSIGLAARGSFVAAGCLSLALALPGCGGTQSGKAPVHPKPKDLASMVRIPAGEFVMGRDGGDPDEAPQRRVTLSEFYIDRTEVTNAAFKSYCDATRRLYPGGIL